MIGNITSDITVVMSDSGESALGDVIADAQLYATSNPEDGGAVVAFTNPGGIRADLVYNQQSADELPGQVTYGEAFSVQPSEISLVTMTLNGTQIDTLLEQQFDNPSPRILQVSKGFSYAWNESAPTGNMVEISSIKINGTSIDPSSLYRVTVNSHMAEGSDNFSVLKEGVNRTEGSLDRDALVNYLEAFLSSGSRTYGSHCSGKIREQWAIYFFERENHRGYCVVCGADLPMASELTENLSQPPSDYIEPLFLCF